MTTHSVAYDLVSLAIARALKPPALTSPSDWARENLVIPDGPRAGEKWDPVLTPYILEPLNFLGPESPVNEIAAMKAAQTAFTQMLIAAVGHSIDLDPCRMMAIMPTDGALSDFNREKLQPSIDLSPALKGKVKQQISRDGSGSTTYSKRFPGGSLTLAIGSSAADLRSQTIKKLFRDEIDEYPDDLDGQGSPLKLSDARQTSFLATGEWKRLDISTPTIKGESKIERRYEAGDQRRWHVPCPHCDEAFVFEFGPQFKFEKDFPHKSHYVAPCCGAIIWPHERDGMVREGRWVATASRPGAFPSYHFDSLSSPFVPWDEIAREAVDAEGDTKRLRVFYNLKLGLPYEETGDGPGYEMLLTRREDYGPRGHIPPQGLILTAAADVQMRGIWFECVAWASDRQSWVVEALYLDGSTEAPDGEAFQQLEKLLDRDWPDAFGKTRRLDALGVDSGYRSHVVYAWAREHKRSHPDSGQNVVLALKGWDGWGRPALGSPSRVDIDLSGKKLRKGGVVWPVGTWPLKSAFNSDLEKVGALGGKEEDPSGYCHFPKWIDHAYFRQITAEVLDERKINGRWKKFWRQRPGQRENHWLDTRIYNMALGQYLGLSSWTPDEVRGLAKKRGLIQPEEVIDPPAPQKSPEGLSISTPAGDEQTFDDDEFDKIAERNSELWR